MAPESQLWETRPAKSWWPPNGLNLELGVTNLDRLEECNKFCHMDSHGHVDDYHFLTSISIVKCYQAQKWTLQGLCVGQPSKRLSQQVFQSLDEPCFQWANGTKNQQKSPWETMDERSELPAPFRSCLRKILSPRVLTVTVKHRGPHVAWFFNTVEAKRSLFTWDLEIVIPTMSRIQLLISSLFEFANCIVETLNLVASSELN
jgi:hypothetical protein